MKKAEASQIADLVTDGELDAMLARMSIEEKIELISGFPHWFTKPNRRYGIPAIQVANGPSGVRPYLKTPIIPSAAFGVARATAFPAGIGLASAWDPQLCHRVGRTIADECNEKGIDLLAGPVVCVTRVAVGGRNFESYGEDPLLSGILAAGFIAGVESDGVGTSIKHFVGNDTDYERHRVDIRVDELTLHELYLRPFQIAIARSNPSAVMFAYPKVNGVFVSDNEHILTRILRERWGFEGITMSDWGAVKSGRNAFLAGSDLEMPRARHFGSELTSFVVENERNRELLDEKVRRIVRFALARERFTRSRSRHYLSRAQRRNVARDAAGDSLVLLKNHASTLPLAIDELTSVAVIGPNSDALRTGGGGSSYVCPERAPSPLSVVRERCGDSIELRHVPGVRRWFDYTPIAERLLYDRDGSKRHGLRAEFFNNIECRGEPVVSTTVSTLAFDWGDFSPASTVYPSYFSARFTGRFVPEETQSLELKLLVREGARLEIDGRTIIDLWGPETESECDTGRLPLRCATAVLDVERDRSYAIKLEYYNTRGKAAVVLGAEPFVADPLGEAVHAARESDATLLFVGTTFQDEHEGWDLDSPRLPGEQVELIRRVAGVNSRTIVVLNNGTPLFIDEWVDSVPALIEAWFPGQEGGAAVADVLFGHVNPSGKLPVTFFRSEKDCPALQGYPGFRNEPDVEVIEDVDAVIEKDDGDNPRIVYSEGLAVGYRAADMNDVAPLFAFGFGLSYSDFELGECTVSADTLAETDNIELKLTVTNRGPLDGSETVQIYAGAARPTERRPPKNLIAFRKVRLTVGSAEEILVPLTRADFERYSVKDQQWTAEPGVYHLFVGTSSTQIHAAFEVQLL